MARSERQKQQLLRNQAKIHGKQPTDPSATSASSGITTNLPQSGRILRESSRSNAENIPPSHPASRRSHSGKPLEAASTPKSAAEAVSSGAALHGALVGSMCQATPQASNTATARTHRHQTREKHYRHELEKTARREKRIRKDKHVLTAKLRALDARFEQECAALKRQLVQASAERMRLEEEAEAQLTREKHLEERVRILQCTKNQLEVEMGGMAAVLTEAAEFASATITLLILSSSDAIEEEKRAVEDVSNKMQVATTRLNRVEKRLVLDQKQLLLLRRQVVRFPGRLAIAADRATEKALVAVRAANAFHLKENGVIPNTARHMVRELVRLSVPVDNVVGVILAVAEAMGMEVLGSLHKRSVARIVLEGLVASKIQIVREIEEAEGVTISGDGTTHKNINFESSNLYLNVGLSHIRRFVGIHSAPNHTSEQQLVGWQTIVQGLYATYNASPQGQAAARDARELPCKITGMTTDHANDQKKLHRLVNGWKTSCDREVRGEKAMMLMVEDDLGVLLEQTTLQAVAEVGGLEKWDAMDHAEKSAWDEAILQRIVRRLGDEQYATLPEEERRSASLFVSGYCCMHKELNAVKGGNVRMAAAWEKLGLTPPLLLMNRDNAAAAEAGVSEAQERAVDVSEGGGVKTTALAGALFRHKDDKKGQQDSFRIFFEASSAVGSPVRFPDTSNTRYQSHCEAAAELLVHLDLYIEFLDFARDKKIKRTFNHMEQNVYLALHDAPTLTELCVLALYSQSISHPYLRQVRGHDAESSNHLDLGPLHARLKAHIRRVIDDPSLLLAPDASYEQATLDGKLWERPDAFYAIHRLAPRLPHLQAILVEFFSGALDTWDQFTGEFAADGLISTLSTSERRRAWMRTTNDDNEGALGSYRVAARHAPSLTLHQYNARTMYKLNDTGTFIKTHLTPEGHAHLRAEARTIDGSGLERKRKREQADADERAVEAKRAKDQKAIESKAAKQQILDSLVPLSDVADVSKLHVPALKLHLDWHRQFDSAVPKTGTLRKPALIEALEAAFWRRQTRDDGVPRGVGVGEHDPECIPQEVCE